jgi:hypothetical protein
MATESATSSSRRTLRVGVPLTVGLFVLAGGVSYFGVDPASGGRQAPGSSTENNQGPHAPRSPVVSITLPYEDPDLPLGPNRAEFQVACATCHSTRLAMTQPPFPRTKWNEVVKKMVVTYGAPLTPDDEAKAVAYLHAVRGK